jgi:site-specific recombinase XerD
MGVSVNAHPKTMQELMGHSSITTTMDIYSDVLTATQRKTADDISAAMGL